MSFSGSLQPKKKIELQALAIALRLSDQGTKDEIHNRIRAHLDKHQATLEEDPAFAGLFGRRKRGVQPQPPSDRSPPESRTQDERHHPVRSTAASRRITAIDPVHESTPVADGAPKSNPFSPNVISSSANLGTPVSQLGTASSPPPSPPSASRSILSVVPRPDIEVIVTMVKRQEETVLKTTSDLLLSMRFLLSNSRNIWFLTATLELLYILYTIIPWKRVQISPVVPLSNSTVSLVYPPWTVFQTHAFWSIIGHWSIPSLFIPALFGALISFHPARNKSRSRPSPHLAPDFTFDPLTASIIRLAAQIAYPFAIIDHGVNVTDVIGFRWRILNAAVGVAFAFAEAIAAISSSSSYKSPLAAEKRFLSGEETAVEEIE